MTPKGLKAATDALNVPAAPANASTTQKGIVELATADEAKKGTDGDRAVTPKGLKAALAALSIFTFISASDVSAGRSSDPWMTSGQRPAGAYRVIAAGTSVDAHGGYVSLVWRVGSSGGWSEIARYTRNTGFNAFVVSGTQVLPEGAVIGLLSSRPRATAHSGWIFWRRDDG